jgi:DNA-binding GntR family transcriptional regulator
LRGVHTTSHADGALRSEVAYAELKQRLLVGDFVLNVRLGEERLASMVGVSRTPVREALHRLHAEGLVRRANDGGFEPVAPDVASVRHLYEVRVGLELQALQRPRRSGQPHDRDSLLALQADWRALRNEPDLEPSPGFVLLDESFHIGLADAAGNPALADLLRQVNERIRVVRMQDFLTAERIELTIEEHIGLVEAVLAGDLAQAELRFGEHVERSMAVVAERVERAIARMITGEHQT